MNRLLTRIYGNPPALGAPKIERLRFVRRVGYYTNIVPLALVLTVSAITLSSPMDWLLPVVCGVPFLQGFAMINLRIRRERRDG